MGPFARVLASPAGHSAMQRELTDEEIDAIAATNLGDYEDGKWHRLFARALLAAARKP